MKHEVMTPAARHVASTRLEVAGVCPWQIISVVSALGHASTAQLDLRLSEERVHSFRTNDDVCAIVGPRCAVAESGCQAAITGLLQCPPQSALNRPWHRQSGSQGICGEAVIVRSQPCR